MFSKLLTVLALAASIPGAFSATSFSDDLMNQLLNAGGVGLAMANAPVWFFGQALNQPPCIPTWAYQGSPDTLDTYDSAHRTNPALQCQYPNVGCNCRKPGVGIGNPAPPFPVYYTYRKCNDGDVRVSLNLFYEKDGARFGAIETGHDFDWERVIVIYKKDSNNQWAAAQLALSQHNGYQKLNWGDIQNTLTTEQAVGDPRQNQDIKNQDHPKVYIGWSKHPNFHTRNTGWNDPASQSLSRAFRSQDWWYFVPSNFYIRADGSTPAGQVMQSQGWGQADSIPPRVNDGMCSV